MRTRNPKYQFLLLAAFFACIISGCATGSLSVKMVPPDYAIQNKHGHTVAVQASGGKETNPLLIPQISDEAFREALIESINKSGAFSAVAALPNADYLLDVAIVDLAQPWGGIDMTVTMNAKWTLTSSKDKTVIFQETIAKPYTAAFADAFIGMERLKLANEGAARENIREGLRKLSELKLAGSVEVASQGQPATTPATSEKSEAPPAAGTTPAPAGPAQSAALPAFKREPIPQHIARSGYTLEYEPMIVSLLRGDFASAHSHTDLLYQKTVTPPAGAKQNRHLALLERGRAALVARKFDQAIADLQEAEKRFLTIEGTISLTEGFGSLLTDDTAMEYEAEMHEKLMISPYLALAYLSKGDFDGARVERNRTLTKISQYIEEKPAERAYLENPFARYLAALMYEMEDRKDDAKIEYRKLKWDQETERLDGKTAKTTDLVVLVDVGLAPQKFERKWPVQQIPTPAGNISLGFAYADYAPLPSEIKTCGVYLDEEPMGEANLLYDLEQTILAQLERNRPDLETKMMARMMAKAAAQLAAKMAAKEALKNIPFASLFSDIAIDAAAEQWLAVEQADLRGWLSLPKQIRYLRVDGLSLGESPGEHTVRIDCGCGAEARKVVLEKDKINIVYFVNPK